MEKFHLQISRTELYPQNSKYVDQLLHEMATKPIVHVGEYLCSPMFPFFNKIPICEISTILNLSVIFLIYWDDKPLLIEFTRLNVTSYYAKENSETVERIGELLWIVRSSMVSGKMHFSRNVFETNEIEDCKLIL